MPIQYSRETSKGYVRYLLPPQYTLENTSTDIVRDHNITISVTLPSEFFDLDLYAIKT